MAKRSLWRRFSDYVRHDFRDIAWPRPMPDPPGTKYISDLPLARHLQVWREAYRKYADGWRWYNGEPEDVKARREAEERAARAEEDASARAADSDGYAPDPDDGTTFKDEFGRIVQVGKEVGFQGWKRQVEYFYRTRGAAYMNAMKEFVAGYKEGVREATNPPSTERDDDAEHRVK